MCGQCSDKISRNSVISGEFHICSKLRTDNVPVIRDTATVLYISMSVFNSQQYKHAGRSSVANIAVQSACSRCESGFKYWIRVKHGRIMLCDEITI